MSDQPRGKTRNTNESFERRGGYLAPKKPFKLPTTGPDQGAKPAPGENPDKK
jgi:hypothetical protein